MSRRSGTDRALRARMLSAIFAALVVAGCAVPRSEISKPSVDVPEAWSGVAHEGRRVTSASWWALFRDPVLDRLIDEALDRNHDIALAVARIDEARAIAAFTEASERPSAFAAAAADRTRVSQRTAMQQPAGTPIERNNLRITANASYEVDLWDRLKNASLAARADLLAAQASRDTVRIAIGAEVAQAYFRLRALDEKLDVLARTLDVRTSTLRLQKQRVDAGIVAELDLRQLDAEIAAIQAQRTFIERDRNREEASLAVLLGRSPRSIMSDEVAKRRAEMAIPIAPVVPAGLPSELLQRRPDILAAEQAIAAASARVDIARVAHFPAVTLTGFLGVESASLSNLFSGPAGIWQFAAALAQPLYAGGRLKAEIEANEARARQAIVRYQSTVQSAFLDVRNALSNQTQAREHVVHEQARITALREAVRLADLRYRGGLTSQLEVLDAQRALLAAELDRIEALRAQRGAIADLMKALGGGWE
jgi:multidrug efflux system outer membrane protein